MTLCTITRRVTFTNLMQFCYFIATLTDELIISILCHKARLVRIRPLSQWKIDKLQMEIDNSAYSQTRIRNPLTAIEKIN